MSVTVAEIAQRVAEGRAVPEAEARVLSASPDLVTVGLLADAVRARRHGDRVTYVRVFEVPLAGESNASEVERAGEVRILGVPESVDVAVQRWRAVAGWAGADRVTAFDLADLAAGDESLARWRPLAQAGCVRLAQASIDRLSDPLRCVQAAAALGFQIPRLTVAHVASGDAAQLASLANALAAVGVGVRAFSPLPSEVLPAEPTTGYDDAKRVAIARLVCDGIDSIQVDWRTYGPKMAQVALLFGADDLDRVSTQDESALGRRRTPMEELRRNLEAASRHGVERGADFEERA